MTKQELKLWTIAKAILNGLDKALEREEGGDLNDSILEQIWGVDETVSELREDIEVGLTEEQVKMWRKSLGQDWEMVKQIEAYQDWKRSAPEVSWIYA